MFWWYWLVLAEITYRFTSGNCRNMEKNCCKINSSMVSINENLVSWTWMPFFSPFIAVSPTASDEEFVIDFRFFSKAAENPAAQTYWERQQNEAAASSENYMAITWIGSFQTNFNKHEMIHANQDIYFQRERERECCIYKHFNYRCIVL